MTEVNGFLCQSSLGLGSKSLHFAASLGECQRVWEEIRDTQKTRIQGGKPSSSIPISGSLSRRQISV